MTDAVQTPGFRLKGWHVLAIVLGFFGVVIAVDVGFAVIAYRTFPGEVSSTPYEDGVAYDRKPAQMAAQAQLGWRAAAGAEAGGVMRVAVRDAQGRPVAGLAATGALERPATESGRIKLAFVEQAPGVYVARARGVAGAWDLSFVGQDKQGRRLEAERRLSWP